VVLPKENHMQPTEAATLDRKSGGADRQFPSRLQQTPDLTHPNPCHDNGLTPPCVHSLNAAV
jgi:hypothetical protein